MELHRTAMNAAVINPAFLSPLEATKELSTVFRRDQLKLDTDANIASDREIVITAVERSVDRNQSLIGFYY